MGYLKSQEVRKMNNITEQRAVELQQKVLNCSAQEQLKFFKNVVNKTVKLHVLEEEIQNLKGDS